MPFDTVLPCFATRMARYFANCPAFAKESKDESQDDPARADRGDQPALPADQVLAVPAARAGHARRLPGRRRRGDDPRRARRARSTSTTTPDLVVIQVYITSARRAYELADHYRARGAYVALGGLHVTSLPDEAAAARRHDLHRARARTPGRASWPTSARASPARATCRRSAPWHGLPPIRRDLIKRQRYLVPNSIVVSRGCPHDCDFCYKDAFFEGGKSFYTQTVDDALAEIDRLPGPPPLLPRRPPARQPRASPTALFDGMRGHGAALAGGRHGRLGPRARTCWSRRSPPGCAACSSASRRSTPATWPRSASARTSDRDYAAAIRRLHDLGVMVNASFVFGMDDDDPDVFDRTVDWAIEQGIETATFHIMTPYPGTGAVPADGGRGPDRCTATGTSTTRGTSSSPAARTDARRSSRPATGGRTATSTAGARSWRGAGAHAGPPRDRLRHLAYAGGWKKFEPVWDRVIRAKRVAHFLPLLEAVLGGHRRAAEPMGLANRLASGSQE